MGFLERWDRRNNAILAEQNEDMKGPDWATKSKGSRRGAIGAASAVASVSLGGAARGFDGSAQWFVLAGGGVLITAVSWWAYRRIERT